MSFLLTVVAYLFVVLLAVVSVYSVGLWAWLSWFGPVRGDAAGSLVGPSELGEFGGRSLCGIGEAGPGV